MCLGCVLDVFRMRFRMCLRWVQDLIWDVFVMGSGWVWDMFVMDLEQVQHELRMCGMGWGCVQELFSIGLGWVQDVFELGLGFGLGLVQHVFRMFFGWMQIWHGIGLALVDDGIRMCLRWVQDGLKSVLDRFRMIVGWVQDGNRIGSRMCLRRVHLFREHAGSSVFPGNSVSRRNYELNPRKLGASSAQARMTSKLIL